jgi:organic hydroperoxide reductase OsmC/OhrA
MADTHGYTAQIARTGDRGDGTRRYRGYDRTWRIATPGKPPIECSNDPLLGGDPAKPNPEDLLLAWGTWLQPDLLGIIGWPLAWR